MSNLVGTRHCPRQPPCCQRHAILLTPSLYAPALISPKQDGECRAPIRQEVKKCLEWKTPCCAMTTHCGPALRLVITVIAQLC